MESFINKGIELLTQAGGKIIAAVLVFIIGRLVIKALVKFFNKAKFMDKLDPTVKSFLLNFLRIGMYAILVISVIGVLGVPMASLVAVLASCAVAVGLALQGALGNLAGGIMLLIFRPFNVGDYISAAGEEGVCKEITLFYTVINTLDNKKITIPNGTLMSANVTNYTAENKRRVDLAFNISGTNDMDKVKEVMLGVINANKDVLHEPEEPFAAPVDVVSGGLQFAVRAWTNTDKYWTVYYDLLKDVSEALGAAGIGGPFQKVKMIDG